MQYVQCSFSKGSYCKYDCVPSSTTKLCLCYALLYLRYISNSTENFPYLPVFDLLMKNHFKILCSLLIGTLKLKQTLIRTLKKDLKARKNGMLYDQKRSQIRCVSVSSAIISNAGIYALEDIKEYQRTRICDKEQHIIHSNCVVFVHFQSVKRFSNNLINYLWVGTQFK